MAIVLESFAPAARAENPDTAIEGLLDWVVGVHQKVQEAIGAMSASGTAPAALMEARRFLDQINTDAVTIAVHAGRVEDPAPEA